MFSGMFSRSATSYSLIQCGPTTGPRACMWPTTALSVAGESVQEKNSNLKMLKIV